ncbi:MAG TPA: exodeoxyribonuclease VII large subunit [Phycisphaerales bacterium]|nr:exodeoxyribonuclease VII large subunit [Phycisphaerales bacterium]
MSRSLYNLPPIAPPPTGPTNGGGRSPEASISVTELASKIESALRLSTPASIRFHGEVTGFTERTHWYFNLKDANAVVSCVMFQTAARRTGFVPRDGQQVIASGRVEFYAKTGRVSVILNTLEPAGLGSLEQALKALMEELRLQGYFAPEHKVALPTFPRRVAVITSRTGAALQDVIVTMRKRCPAVGVLLCDVRVQGSAAAPEVAAMIRHVDANAEALGVDAIILTRGGGSLEDLWAFNEREVADAVFACRLPIVAAIGHETDTTIAELVADERCATPTQAAMRLTPDTAALLQQVDSLGGQLTTSLQRMARFERQRLVGAARHPFFMNPRALIERARERLVSAEECLGEALSKRITALRHRTEQLGARLERNSPATVHTRIVSRVAANEQRLARALQVRVQQSRATIDGVERHLGSVSPLRILDRGFSVTMTLDGRVVRSPADISPGEVIESRVKGGTVRSVVGERDAVAAPAAVPPAVPARRKSGAGPAGPGLFG